jgi:diacylglycerol kinase family enzyme
MMELTAHDISPDDILVGSLPLGTGNDFARMSGWGGTIPWAFANRVSDDFVESAVIPPSPHH